jgi:hypothetical protein
MYIEPCTFEFPKKYREKTKEERAEYQLDWKRNRLADESDEQREQRLTSLRRCYEKMKQDETTEEYQTRLQQNRSYSRNRSDTLHDRVNEIKLASGCVDCGYREHAVALDFDHLNGDEKISSVADLANDRCGWDKIQTEIDKCEVVCANCHRVRTALRRKAT